MPEVVRGRRMCRLPQGDLASLALESSRHPPSIRLPNGFFFVLRRVKQLPVCLSGLDASLALAFVAVGFCCQQNPRPVIRVTESLICLTSPHLLFSRGLFRLVTCALQYC